MGKQSVALCGAWAGTIAWSSSRQARYAGCLVWRRSCHQRWMGWMMLQSSWCFRAARRCIHGLCDGRLISFSQALKAKCWLGSMAFCRGAFGRAKGLGMQLSGSLRVDSGARRQQRFSRSMAVPGKMMREAVERKALAACRVADWAENKNGPVSGAANFEGGQRGIRTPDTRIFSPLLYQLSYLTGCCKQDSSITIPNRR